MAFKRRISTTISAFFLLFCTLANAAVITVDSDSDGVVSTALCQLRDAILSSNSDIAVDGCTQGNGDDLIQFSIVDTTIILESSLPAILDEVEIIGPGRERLSIDGANSYRMFNLGGNLNWFTLRDLKLLQGFFNGNGGCMYAPLVPELLIEDVTFEECQAPTGGAIWMASPSATTTTIRRSVFIDNTGSSFAGAAYLAGTNSEILIEDSIFNGNIAPTAGGVAVGSSSNLIIRRSTFWGNQSVLYGSAVVNFSLSSTLRIEHSTISQNTLSALVSAEGGAIHNASSLTLLNTVVADNPESHPTNNFRDIFTTATGSTISEGHNFVGSNEGSATDLPAGTQANGDQIGTDDARLDPGLGALMDNGGPTLSSLPDLSSLLVDQGYCPGQVSDQRGFGNTSTGLRPVDVAGVVNLDDGCDIGATELQAVSLSPLSFQDSFEDLAP